MPLQPEQPKGPNNDVLGNSLPDPDADYGRKTDIGGATDPTTTARQTLVINWKTSGRGQGRKTN